MHPAPVVMVNTIRIRIHIMIIQIYFLNTPNRPSSPTTIPTTATTSLIDTSQMHLLHHTIPLQQHIPQLLIPRVPAHIQLLDQAITSPLPKPPPLFSPDHPSHLPTTLIKIMTKRNHMPPPPLISIKNGEWDRSYHQYPLCQSIKDILPGTHMPSRHQLMQLHRLPVEQHIGTRSGIS